MEHKRAIILSGAGRYADPWHPFAETSARIAELLLEVNIRASIREDVDAALAELAELASGSPSAPSGPRTRPDLLVVNVGAAGPLGDGESAIDDRARAGLLRYLDDGGSLLAVHVSATSLEFVPEREAILGGIWVRGTTMHPEYSLASIRVHAERHEIVSESSDFELWDERYSWLRVDPAIVPLADHEHDGERHPVLWAHDYRGSRIVYDALGHDSRSYDSGEHRRILLKAAKWLTRPLDDCGQPPPPPMTAR